MDRNTLKLYEDVAALHLRNGLYSWNVDATDVAGRVGDVINSIVPDVHGVYQAASPWDAAIFLVNLQAREGFVELERRLAYGETIETPKFKKIFRGQKAGYTNIQPSAWRTDTWARSGVPIERGNSWLAAFGLLMKLTTESATNGLSLQATLYHAVAQHYQIPTDLLDWSVDPFMAIWFAHWGIVKKGDRGKVYCVELENEDRSTIVLPPPFAKRLFRQRGLFNYTTQPNAIANDALYQRSIKIEFPLAGSWSLPKAYPWHYNNQLLLQDWFISDVRERAKKIALEVDPHYFNFIDDVDESVVRAGVENAKNNVLKQHLEALTRQHGNRFVRSEWESLLQQWIVQVESYVNWLCMMDSSIGQHLTVPGSIIALENLNRDSMYLYARYIIDLGEASVGADRVRAARESLHRLRTRFPELNNRTT